MWADFGREEEFIDAKSPAWEFTPRGWMLRCHEEFWVAQPKGLEEEPSSESCFGGRNLAQLGGCCWPFFWCGTWENCSSKGWNASSVQSDCGSYRKRRWKWFGRSLMAPALYPHRTKEVEPDSNCSLQVGQCKARNWFGVFFLEDSHGFVPLLHLGYTNPTSTGVWVSQSLQCAANILPVLKTTMHTPVSRNPPVSAPGDTQSAHSPSPHTCFQTANSLDDLAHSSDNEIICTIIIIFLSFVYGCHISTSIKSILWGFPCPHVVNCGL